MVNIIWTERLQHAFEDYVRLAKDADTNVSLELVRKVSTSLLAHEKKTEGAKREAGSPEPTEPSKYWIHTLIKGSGVYVAPPPAKEKNPELERVLNEARAKIAAKDYNRMTDNVSMTSSGSGSLREQIAELREMKSTLITIVNVLYTGVAVFVAVYMLSKHVFEDIGLRFLLGFLGFVMIVASETYLYYRHVTADDHASPRRSKCPSPDPGASTSASYDIIKNSLHDEVMKAAATSSSSKLNAAADEKMTPAEPLVNTSTTTATTTATTTSSTTASTTTKRRSKKA
ncbi:hypothetical protein DFQ27_002615 [Actinomortierella ambigua]|uniref:Endoplasmic reticulum-based factor for assembly of V-ATPase n=1 Tax=Actinomortierella ambigua TaxID=1343610 RepID=A0A9P6UDH9_9FUNG|nr:hypothetical protein DFQ27_002615 [Actinomortierella ambigua]